MKLSFRFVETDLLQIKKSARSLILILLRPYFVMLNVKSNLLMDMKSNVTGLQDLSFKLVLNQQD